MTRLIDADAVLEWFAKYWAMQKKLGRPSKQQQAIYMTMRTMVNSVKTVDAVPVVRCKDCIYYKEVSGWHRPICSRIIKNINADDYCSYGVKMPPVGTIS